MPDLLVLEVSVRKEETVLGEREVSKRKTYPIEFEWFARKPTRGYQRAPSTRCWNAPFWYGDGQMATEPSVILRRADYNAMRRELRELREKQSGPKYVRPSREHPLK